MKNENIRLKFDMKNKIAGGKKLENCQSLRN